MVVIEFFISGTILKQVIKCEYVICLSYQKYTEDISGIIDMDKQLVFNADHSTFLGH